LTEKFIFMKTEPVPFSHFIREIYGYDLYGYQLVMQPAAGVYAKIMAERQRGYDEYKDPSFIHGTPQITIAAFFAKEAMEETLSRWIQRICSRQHSFTVTLNNYSALPGHTIYLRVQDADPFRQLTTDLQVLNTYITSCACPPVQFNSKPFVSIAANIRKDVYPKALRQYAHQSFHESFVVNELHLLRKKHEYDVGKPVNVFGLQPEENKQSVYP
jgi:hypothetical protein